MKATEVLNRYANGERDFRRANLRGQSFKGQDLSGADFTEADICGANFTNAILKETNFAGVRAGVQKRWFISQLIITFTLGVGMIALSTLIYSTLVVILFSSEAAIPDWIKLLSVVFGLILTSVICFAFAYQGMTTKALITVFTVTVGSVIPFAIFGSVLGNFHVVASLSITVAAILASTVAGSIVFVGVAALVYKLSFAAFVAVSGFWTSALILDNLGLFEAAGTAIYFLVILLVIFVAGFYIFVAWRTLKNDKKFVLVRTFGIAFSATGGTSFRGADLTNVNFSNAILKGTNFNHAKQRQTILKWVCWKDSTKLDYARVGDSILANPAVRELLVTHNGYKKSYIDAKLRTANLNGVNLEHADLTWADLSCAHLRQANLKDAKLIEVLALDTDFTGATLTGACLEGWNIDSNTRLEDVDCQYVYLLRDQQERRPGSGDFAPGEFTKLFQEALNTVDLIFRNGVDWKAFVAAFKTVQVDNDGTELTIQSIENKGDGVVVVRVSVPETADKAKIHSEFNQNYDLALKALEAKYHAELKAKDEQITIYREKSADMTEILRLLANRPVTVEVNASAESKAMSDSTDKSQTVNIGGNITGSTINLGAISGSVSNVVNQLPNAPDPAQPGIKELLIELQAAIESDADLPEKGKASALEQVKVLAEVAQAPEQPEKKGLGSQAITFFKNAASFLPDTAKLAEACSKLLPLITKALGLPF